MRKTLLIVCICNLIVSSIVAGDEDSLRVDDYYYRISLEQKVIPFENDLDTLCLFLNAPDIPLGGYDFKFQLRSSQYEITAVSPGQFFDECNWEFFKAINIGQKTADTEYSSIWQVIALADLIADTVQPFCYFAPESDAILAEIIIQKRLLVQTRDDSVPIFFWWEDCSDNSISGKTGNELYLSEKVVDYLPDTLVSRNNQFPTSKGTPQNCFRQGGLNSPRRSIEFHHGRLIIDFKAVTDSTTSDK